MKIRNNQAIILAGGKGTRLAERLNGLPKPLIDIAGVPLLERQILLLKQNDFDEVIILVNYRAQQIVDFCQKRNNWDLNIKIVDDGEPLGTAGALLKSYNLLADEFLVIYGDTMLDVDLRSFFKYHNEFKSDATIFLHPNDHPYDSDLVEVDEQYNVLAIHSYPHPQDKYFKNLVNAALYCIKKESLISWAKSTRVMDIAKDLFPLMIDENKKIKGYNSFEYIKDCGTPKRLDKVILDFHSGKIIRSKKNSKQKAIFIDRDGTINEEKNHLNRHEDFLLLKNAAKAIKGFNNEEFRVCVITNQPVIARGECTISELDLIHSKLETELGKEGAFVDRIYYCPHHPDLGFKNEIPELKIDCECRKPGIGLINKAIFDLNIDIKKSWMIGDTSTDILTAKNAGLNSILVETGYAGLDFKYLVSPDFILPDLYSAFRFINFQLPTLINFIEQSIPSDYKFYFIGGQSRSGKSTFAATLKLKLLQKEKVVHHISLDRWILSEDKRGSGVLARYDLKEIEKFLNIISKSTDFPLKLQLPFYIKNKKIQIKDVEDLIIQKDDIFIIEGVIALSLIDKIKLKSFSINISINEEKRKERIINEYIIRGLSHLEVEKIYKSRINDEYYVVENFSTNANTEICMDKIIFNNDNK
jgi:histidinol-phosphate phosphatase family protein